MTPENPPPVDPADLPLLMTPDQLRNPAPKNSNVSFLRRTQYIASGGAGRAIDGKSVPTAKTAKSPKQQKPTRDDPAHVKKYIVKGFDLAYPKSKHMGEDTENRIKGHPSTKAEADAWANPVHPDDPKLKPVGLYSFMPDLSAFPDPGGFLQVKFDKAPVQPNKGKRDDRMDVGVLVPSPPEDRVSQEHASKVALHKANPTLYPAPGPLPFDYDLFLPEKEDSTTQIQKTLDIDSPNRDDPDNYTHENADGGKFHKYDRVRTYATNSQVLNTEQKYKDVAIILHDPPEDSEDKDGTLHRLDKRGAYYYPIVSKLRLKPERSRTIAQAGLAPTLPKDKDQQLHQIQLSLRDPDEAESYKRATHRAQVDSAFAKTMPQAPERVEEDGGEVPDGDDNNAEVADAPAEDQDAPEPDQKSEPDSTPKPDGTHVEE